MPWRKAENFANKSVDDPYAGYDDVEGILNHAIFSSISAPCFELGFFLAIRMNTAPLCYRPDPLKSRLR